MMYWVIRALVMVAWFAFIVALIPVFNINQYIDILPDFVVFWFNYFMIPTVFAIIVAPDIARFVIRRFNV